MTSQARLIDTFVPDDPSAAVLVLHGGASRRRNMMVSPAQLSVVRMIPIAARIGRRGQGSLAVFRLLNSVRGWDDSHTPVDDARWALGQLKERFGRALPTCLVGHSLGGRAALLAGGEPSVRSVVALAPWVYPTDAAGGLADREVLIVHGTADRIARPANSAAVAESLARRAGTGHVGYVRVIGAKHAMLRRHAVFDGLAAEFAAATLLAPEAGRADGSGAEATVARVLAGEHRIDL
jgi:predicted esterase